MRIIAQNKMEDYNYDDLTIVVSEYTPCTVEGIDQNGNQFALGEYATKEGAMAVLEDIYTVYARLDNGHGVYRMMSAAEVEKRLLEMEQEEVNETEIVDSLEEIVNDDSTNS